MNAIDPQNELEVVVCILAPREGESSDGSELFDGHGEEATEG